MNEQPGSNHETDLHVLGWPTSPAVAEAGEVVPETADEDGGADGRSRTVSEITEKTKLGLTLTAAVVCVLFLLKMGAWWGEISSERIHNSETLARHEADIRELRQTFTAMQSTLQSIQEKQDSQRESLNTAVRNTTFMVDKMGQVQVALAEKGIVVKGD